MNNPIRVDDQYLMQELKLSKSFIVRHARAMGNRTKPRAYFLDTVIAYLRRLEMEMQRKAQGRVIDDLRHKEEVMRLFEEAKIAVMARRKIV